MKEIINLLTDLASLSLWVMVVMMQFTHQKVYGAALWALGIACALSVAALALRVSGWFL